MTSPDLRERLAAHRGVGSAPSNEIAWLAERGALRSFRTGEAITQNAQREERLHVVLSGHIAIRTDRGAGSRKIIEWRAGGATVAE